jgi:hypothetical protein
LRPEKNFARGRQRQNLKDLSAEREEDIAKENDKRNAVGDSVVRRENEGALRLLMEQYSAKKRSLIGSERRIYLFGDLPLPSGKG